MRHGQRRRDVRARLTRLAEEILTYSDDEGPKELLRKDVRVHPRDLPRRGKPPSRGHLGELGFARHRIWCLCLDWLPGVSDHVREHVALLQAIVADDKETAAALSLAHIESFEQAIRKIL